ncbi:hypothetical protein V8F06_006961 [Rhypophila decipiens]
MIGAVGEDTGFDKDILSFISSHSVSYCSSCNVETAHAMQDEVDLQEHADSEVTTAVQYYPPTRLPLPDVLSVCKSVELASTPSLPGVHIEEPCRSPRKRTKVAEASMRRTDAQRKVNEPKARWILSVGGGGSQPELSNHHRSTWQSSSSLLRWLGAGSIKKSLDQGSSMKVALGDLKSICKQLNYTLPPRGWFVDDWLQSMMNVGTWRA